MAPFAATAELSLAPLADYFFIAGIESSQVFDERSQPKPDPASPPAVEETITEDVAEEGEQDARLASGDGTASPDAAFIKRHRSRFSYEMRKSVSSVINVETPSRSNRSSATIKALQTDSPGLTEQDFEQALRKFAAERDSFLEEIQFSAGTLPQQTKPRPRPKTQRITSEDVGTLRSGVGSIRRRLSTMSSMKRQPVSRQSSTRTSKRLSGYNSVIPAPQPFHTSPNEHPLKRRYEPVLLDRYPPSNMTEELNRRNQFPDYVPMFTFPNDVNVVSSDERPRSTWHGFAMTQGDNSKLYGICLIIWMPLHQNAAEELERQCEVWRKANMTNEERELAASLGERLATERAKLSSLLAELPTLLQGSDEREKLEDEISAVEEKIGLMTDLLRPVRHGAASKIDGLTDSDSGLWIPRAYGILGRDGQLTSFWKEWLRAVVVPMTNGAILRVPASSPKIGMWQPLERYVVNLCAEALSPISSITQVELSIRDLRLYARKNANNEIPGSRNVDLYALFRSLSLPNILVLFEYVLAEARIILLSSYTSMLHLSTAALAHLLYPLKWAGVFIPVLPARLIQALEAPCPYIVGIERRYENVELPEDDFVLVDLDQDTIESTARPIQLPRPQRKKLMYLLQQAAPHHIKYGVPIGPPAYAKEAFPHNAFSSENSTIFTPRAPASTLATLVSLNSASFGEAGFLSNTRLPVINAFMHRQAEQNRGPERPSTSHTASTKSSSPPSPRLSPVSANFPQMPSTPVSRSDSGYALQATLREKRSGHFDQASRRSASHAFERMPTVRRPSLPFGSTSNLVNYHDAPLPPTYAPSVYAQSTLAASTIMPGILMQPPRNSENNRWVEGHCLQWRRLDDKSTCSVCEEKAEDGMYKCTGCQVYAHSRCTSQLCLVCTAAFRPELVRAAFVRCLASLFYTYRRFLQPAHGDQKRNGMIYKFNPEAFLKSMPHENSEYIAMLQQTQAFDEFIREREHTRPDDPSIKLFDQIILSKKNRGKTSIFSKSTTDFLSDHSDHLWRSAAAAPPSARFPGDYRQVITRIPAKLDPALMKEPRVIQGVLRIPQAKARRKPIPSMLSRSVS